MTFDVTTNRIPFGLLTPEEQATLKAWPHDWKFHNPAWEDDGWVSCGFTPSWIKSFVYCGEPAPKVKCCWFNIYAGDNIGIIWTSQDAAASAAKLAPVPNNVITMRMQICNGEVTVTKET
jgi:hypothetical protein